MEFIVYTSDLKRYATGLCAYGVCKSLGEKGHRVHIINLDQNTSTTREGNVIIYNVEKDLLRRRILKLSENKMQHGVKLLKFLLRIIIQIKAIFTLVPVLSCHKKLINRTIEVLNNHNCDMIVAVVNPMESIMAAKYISNNYNIPYCAYYLDSIFGNNGIRVLSNNTFKKKALKFEEQYLSGAKKVFMMRSAKGMYKSFGFGEPSFNEKIIYVDIPLLKVEEKYNPHPFEYWDKNQIVILYVGTMPKNIRRPHYALALIDRVAQDNVHFYIAGQTDYGELIDEYIRKNHNIHYLGYVDHDQVRSLLMDATVLLNIGNSIDTMIPSKIFEYMSYGKPIISTQKIKSDKTSYYLGLYGNALIVDENESLTDSIDNVISFIRKSSMSQNNGLQELKKLCRFNGPLYSNTPECISNYLETVIVQ